MIRTLQIARRALASAALALLLSCGGGGGDAIVGEPPAVETLTEDELDEQRAERDRWFATAPESPIAAGRRASFEGLDYYAHDPSLRFVVRLEPYDDPEPLRMVTTEGDVRPGVRVGRVRFTLDGAERELQVYHLRDSSVAAWGQPFLPFMDATTGGETYPAGRYVELAPASGDWYVLDFNLAYNPHCAYGATGLACPRTPEENRLPMPIRAGERGPDEGGAAEGAAGPEHGTEDRAR